MQERDGIKVEEFSPAPLDQVARIVWQCYGQLGEFSLAELISFCLEPSLASVVTQLHQRGTSRGNYQQTMKDALDSVEQYHERRQVEQLTQQVLKAGSGDQGEDVSQQALMALHKRLRNSGGRGAAVLGEH